MHTRGQGRSDVGRRRDQNEDSFWVDDALGLYVVADGMGGHAGGEIASAKAIETVVELVQAEAPLLRAVADGDGDRHALERLAERLIMEASRRVYELATSADGQPGMGCTMTLLLCAGHVGVLGHVGDSRLYLLRDERVSQLSNDHTIAADLARAGHMNPADFANTPYAHVLSRAVGTQQVVQVDTLLLDLLPGDRFVLCSDGYSNYLEDRASLLEHVRDDDLDAAAEGMVAHANDSGGADNITVLLVSVESKQPETERIAAVGESFDALGAVFLFEHLELPLLARVMSSCTFEPFPEGAEVVAQGAPCNQLLVVVDGRFDLVHDGKTVGTLGRSDHAGATTLLEPRPARSSVRAATNGHLLRLDGKRFAILIRERPWLGIGLLERLGRRLSADLDRSYVQRDGSTDNPVADRERF
jgi:serine/threonine protein phosphatase PrpC